MDSETPTAPVQTRKHALAFIAVTLLLATIGFGLIMPVYPRLLVELTGESLSRAAVYGGWLGFVYAAIQFISAPILGNLSDRYGRRRIFATGLVSFGIISALCGPKQNGSPSTA